MRTGEPSKTALLAAMARARHQVLDGGQVFHDPLALRILGAQAAAEITASQGQKEGRLARAFRGPLAARSRIAEDTIGDAAATGVTQCVVLGAGLDTFAYRNPFPEVKVFEVDHPATQLWKRSLLSEAGIAVPDAVAFVDVDFEHQDLFTRLREAGFDSSRPAVYSWLGVTVYLPPATVMSTLRAIQASSAAGSMVVFDYVRKPGRLDLLRRCALWLLSRRYARFGEPWHGFLSESELASDMQTMGYRSIDFFRPADIARSLFGGLHIPRRTRRFNGLIGGVVKAAW